MLVWIALAVLLAWAAMIYYFGGGQWGRGQTQQIIDRFRDSHPWLHAWLNRHHGKLRASWHYVEFGGLTLILFGIFSWMSSSSPFEWSAVRAMGAGGISAVAALLDELHQLRSGTRQFRRVDYLHSCCGIAIVLLLLRYGAWMAEVWG